MLWLKSHTLLMRHPKVIFIAKALRLRRSYLIGHLHSLWHAVLEIQEDGDLSLWPDDMIAEFSDYPGDAPQWVRLLHEHGFLADRKIHDWLDHAGPYLTSKYKSSNPEKLEAIWQKHGKNYTNPPKEEKRKTLGKGKEQQKNNSGTTQEQLDKIRLDKTRKDHSVSDGVPISDQKPEAKTGAHETVPNDPSLLVKFLTTEWYFFYAGTKVRDHEAMDKFFASMVEDDGLDPQFILAQIRAKRSKIEPEWDFRKRCLAIAQKQSEDPGYKTREQIHAEYLEGQKRLARLGED